MKVVRHPMVKRIAAIVGLCVIVLFVCSMFTEEAYAQGGAKTSAGDKKAAAKDSPFTKKEVDESQLAKPWQKWLGLGSIPVMIIVVKYL